MGTIKKMFVSDEETEKRLDDLQLVRRQNRSVLTREAIRIYHDLLKQQKLEPVAAKT